MLAEAVVSLERSLELRPNNAEVHNELANVLFLQQNFDAAKTQYQRVLQLEPGSAEANYNLANVFHQQGNFDEAVRHFREAIRLSPDLPEAHNNLAITLKRQGKLDEAIRSYKQALHLKPDYADAITNLGTIHELEGRFDEALATYEKALKLHPDHVNLHFHRAGLWLLLGRWTEGWPEYEWRWKTPKMPGYGFHQPRWDGSALTGRTILLEAEQGLGDAIHFVRYAALVKERGGRVLLQCDPVLTHLLAGVPGVDQLFPRGAELPPFDVYMPLLSLPAIFRTTPSNVPASIPYLKTDPGLVEQWRRKLKVHCRVGGVFGTHRDELVGSEDSTHPTNTFKVGIAWQGNPTFLDDNLRSMPLKCFAPLAAVPGVQLISLQKGPGTDQLQSLNGDFSVVDIGDQLDAANRSFVDTAAIMKSLDLVISSDTSVAHLAGALGLPVWVALPFVPDWRWLLHRPDTPWYPTMRLFRQTRRGDWDGVFQRMAAELNELVKGNSK